ncbi:hypothetical protein PCK1_000724 [Pneumocystis canis]|nr:hypothetical protein PCK1_000724 [Pneumocystis canis]
MFSSNIFFQEITCPHIRKNTNCNILVCPFNHTSYDIHKERLISKKQKYNHESNIYNIHLPESHIKMENLAKINNFRYNEASFHKKIHTNDNNYTIIHYSSVTKENNIFRNISQDQINTEDIGPKFIPNLIHIPHKTQYIQNPIKATF